MRILYIEPFEGGSHARFTRVITERVKADWSCLTLPGRHWKWRMRGAVPYFALARSEILARRHDLVLASAYVPLAELIGLFPDLGRVPRILYFHENQLAYPVRDEHTGERDLHFGLTQMVSALAATRCVFNSRFNRDSFSAAGVALLSRMPDAVPPEWMEQIGSRSRVISVPLDLPEVRSADLIDRAYGDERAAGPIVLWNHRWEHDKNPEAFFSALRRLVDWSIPFRLAVCGRRYRQTPGVFEAAREWLGDRVVHWGFAKDRQDYLRLLRRSHVAVSTALHEFFGVSMLEATWFGARPLVPDRLVYPEHFPPEYRYRDDAELARRLAELCDAWTGGDAVLRADRRDLVRPYRSENVLPELEALFDEALSSQREKMT